MLDFFNIEKYKENNRLEAKAAAVGLPKSLWATYSAFANTNGGKKRAKKLILEKN